MVGISALSSLNSGTHQPFDGLFCPHLTHRFTVVESFAIKDAIATMAHNLETQTFYAVSVAQLRSDSFWLRGALHVGV